MKKTPRISIAPMMDWTDRHYRYFMRLITRHTLLYTEMINANAITLGDAARFLKYDASEHPLAIQLGGSEPHALTLSAKMAEDAGFDEVNLNVGCPSDRVQAGRFGACLMAEPTLVAECVASMKESVNVPVTVKTRIGIDKQENYEFLYQFIETVANAGCETFIIHARKAWLNGLSPKENRTVPPLRYDIVRQVKQDFPTLKICINGGITDPRSVINEFDDLDGVMIGREAYHNPYSFATVDADVFGAKTTPMTRKDIIENYLPYIKMELANGTRLSQMTRHILGLFQGVPGARAWRRYLSEHSNKQNAGVNVIRDALMEF